MGGPPAGRPRGGAAGREHGLDSQAPVVLPKRMRSAHPATTGQTRTDRPDDPERAAAGRVVEFVRRLIESRDLKAGDRLAPERELAAQIGVSRPSLRSGLRTLQAMGVIRSRQGSGTYVMDGPPRMSDGPLRFLAALHGFGRDEMFEARRVLEVAAAGLAAERARAEHITALAEEVASLFASLADPQAYLVHDIQFHRAVAAGAENRVIETLVDTLSELVYEERRKTAERSRDLRESADMHRRVYAAIKARDAERARREMTAHLQLAREAQLLEEGAGAARPETAVESSRPDKGLARRGRSRD
jgi:GntR family transcriptional regulator, transcriptional repressor for pyruvate dehydrogenase complex